MTKPILLHEEEIPQHAPLLTEVHGCASIVVTDVLQSLQFVALQCAVITWKERRADTVSRLVLMLHVLRGSLSDRFS